MNRLEGKRTLITGGTSGIGLETARQFIAEGARVAVTGTNPKTIEEARAVLGNDARLKAPCQWRICRPASTAASTSTCAARSS